jgi:hypothetical protein
LLGGRYIPTPAGIRTLSGMSSLLTSSNARFVFLIIAYVFSSTKLGIRAEQVLPGSEGVGGRGRGRGRVVGEKWPKQCMHM